MGAVGGGGIPPVGISGGNLFNRRRSAIRLLPLITVILRYAATCNIARLPRRSVTKTDECGELRHTVWWLTGRYAAGNVVYHGGRRWVGWRRVYSAELNSKSDSGREYMGGLVGWGGMAECLYRDL